MNSLFKTVPLHKLSVGFFTSLLFFVSFLPIAYYGSTSITEPTVVLAQEEGDEEEVAEQEGGNTNPGDASAELLNPLRATDLLEFLMDVLDVLLLFALPIIIFFIMYGGFKLVTARGESEKISEGRAAITAAVIGGVIVLGAKTIMEVIRGTVDSL